MNKKIIRIATGGAVTSVAVSGMAFAAAAPASAAPIKGKITISAPASVEYGSTFTVNCRAKPVLRSYPTIVGMVWGDGSASRGVSPNGNCRMRAITDIKGTHKFFIKSKKNGMVYKSNVVTINVY